MRVFAGKLVNSFFLKDENSSDLKIFDKGSKKNGAEHKKQKNHENKNIIYYLSNNQNLKVEIKKSFQKMKSVLSPYTVRYYNCFDYTYEHDCFNFQKEPTKIYSTQSLKNSSSFSNFNENNFSLHQNFNHHYNIPNYPDTERSSKARELKKINEKNRTLLVLMEFCDRGSVRDILDYQKEVLSEDQISIIMKNVLTAFDILHNQQRIVHGGLKCSNILLNSNGFVKVSGYGIKENFRSGSSKNFTLLGLPYWMSPESIRDNIFSKETDIWSIGITAVEMAEGSPPYVELKPSQAIVKICQKGFPGYRFRNGHSKFFRDFVKHCLEMNPAKRWTVSQLLKHPFITASSILPRQPTMRPLIKKILPKIEFQNCENSMDALKGLEIDENNESEDIKKFVQKAKELKEKITYQPFNVACNPNADLFKIYSGLRKKKWTKSDLVKIFVFSFFFLLSALLLFTGNKKLSLLCLLSQIIFVFG